MGSWNQWLIDLLVYWFIESSTHSFTKSLIHRLTDSPVHQCNDSLILWITESLKLIHWIIGSLNHRFTASLVHWIIADSSTHYFSHSLTHWTVDSLIHQLTISVTHWFTDSLIPWCNDSLICRFIGSPVSWFIEPLLRCFIDSLVHWFSQLCTDYFMSCHWHLNQSFSFVDAPHNFNRSWLLHLKNVPMGHWFPIAMSYFRNFRPGAGGGLSNFLSAWWFRPIPKRLLISIIPSMVEKTIKIRNRQAAMTYIHILVIWSGWPQRINQWICISGKKWAIEFEYNLMKIET